MKYKNYKVNRKYANMREIMRWTVLTSLVGNGCCKYFELIFFARRFPSTSEYIVKGKDFSIKSLISRGHIL